MTTPFVVPALPAAPPGTLHGVKAERDGADARGKGVDAASDGRPQGPPTVLVIDDFEPVRFLLARYLDRLGYRMIAVADAASAIQALDEAAVDHVLLDVNLPGGSDSVYRHIVETKNGLHRRTSFITGGFVDAETERFVRETGCEALFKPFDLARLRQLLER